MFEQNTDASGGADKKYYGKYTGIRLKNDASEPEGAVLRGEILVQIPGILEEAPEGEQQWRPLQAWAKPCFPAGFFVIPKVNDPVWVEFVAGDINFPIWSGAWYPDEAQPKTVDGEPPTEFQKIIRTACGHVIQIDDTEGEEGIAINHKSQARINIDKNGSILIVNKKGSFVFLNAEQGELTLGEEHGNLVTLTGEHVLITNKDSKIALEMKEGKLTILSSEAVDIVSSKFNLHCGTISLGGAKAVSKTVIGDILLAQFNSHTHATALGPSGPPIPPLLPAALSNTVKVMP